MDLPQHTTTVVGPIHIYGIFPPTFISRKLHRFFLPFDVHLILMTCKRWLTILLGNNNSISAATIETPSTQSQHHPKFLFPPSSHCTSNSSLNSTLSFIWIYLNVVKNWSKHVSWLWKTAVISDLAKLCWKNTQTSKKKKSKKQNKQTKKKNSSSNRRADGWVVNDVCC